MGDEQAGDKDLGHEKFMDFIATEPDDRFAFQAMCMEITEQRTRGDQVT